MASPEFPLAGEKYYDAATNEWVEVGWPPLPHAPLLPVVALHHGSPLPVRHKVKESEARHGLHSWLQS